MDNPSPTPRTPKPPWLRISLRESGAYRSVRRSVGGLATVCEQARCPNRHHCWGELGTATFLLLGDTCTRNCRFCSVGHGRPPAPVAEEGERVAAAVAEMGLRHVVLTMVTRDDLGDGGAAHLRHCIEAVRSRCPGVRVELLCSDLAGNEQALADLLAVRPEVFAHNLETVERLTNLWRPAASYRRSLQVLTRARDVRPTLPVKSALLLGMGETDQEILDSMAHLREAGVDVLNLGQYLQPTPDQLPVDRYLHPDQFSALRERALGMGFTACAAAPLVRSSYHAADQFNDVCGG